MAFPVHDDRHCELGEGALWHPGRGQLFWFDIPARRLLTRGDAGPAAWDLGEMASAAGWVDRDTLLVASETALLSFDIAGGRAERICPLEAGNPATRSNDGRADPWGGFWIGTMGKAAEPGAGAIYRYLRGELRRLFAPLTIPNAISFDPAHRFACFADTAPGRVWRVALDPATGWPAAAPEVFLDLGGKSPDGAVFDAAGRLWLAEWGGGRVTAHAADGSVAARLDLPVRNPTCPAFGGADLRILHVTSARQGLGAAELAAEPRNGMTLAVPVEAQGLPEYRVAL